MLLRNLNRRVVTHRWDPSAPGMGYWERYAQSKATTPRPAFRTKAPEARGLRGPYNTNRIKRLPDGRRAAVCSTCGDTFVLKRTGPAPRMCEDCQ